MRIDVAKVIDSLSRRRKIFHSKNDFQNGIAREIERTYNTGVCIDYRHSAMTDRTRLEIWLPVEKVALKIRYRTRAISCRINGEDFELRNHSAQDQGRYSYIADIERLEKLQLSGEISEGYAMLLTNDHLYWSKPKKKGIDSEFKLHEFDENNARRSITGVLNWNPDAGDGSTAGYDKEIDLKNEYALNWSSYSELADDSGQRHQFKYLLTHIGLR